MPDTTRNHYAGVPAATLMVAVLLLLLQLPPALLRPSEFVQDDSYFYLQIADHIVAGEGSTFHGITPARSRR